MLNTVNSINNIRFLDEISTKKTIIHNMHALSKLFVTMVYIVTVLSFGKYDIISLIPFVFYPMIIFALGEIPFLPICKRVLLVLPIVIGIGLFNPILDTTPYIVVRGVGISGGWISFLSLIIKCSLTVVGGLLLIVTTGIENIACALRKLRIPKIIVVQFVLTYRYISLLLEETYRIQKAYHLRAPMQKGISFTVLGSLMGQMLLRSFERANRIYNAMIVRGFHGDYIFGTNNQLGKSSIVYMCVWTAFFVVARFFNIPELLGQIITEVVQCIIL